MLICDPGPVPGNASRYFDDPVAAAAQPRGRLGIAVSDAGHVHNALFAPELIRYDAGYLTTSCEVSGAGWLPTLEYLPYVLRHWTGSPPSVCDVGCGQGEFVAALRGRGVEAVGFDPVLRAPGEHLYRDYWTPQDSRGDADLLVMRCVLPHIPDPWAWLQRAASRPRHVLIEFQRLEWLVEKSVWYGLNHDHVNYFRLQDFTTRYRVVDSGRFADGEWAWVLIQIGGDDIAQEQASSDGDMGHSPLPGVSSLNQSRADATEHLRAVERPIVLWGAAGKGVVAADALLRSDILVLAAVDLDANKWDKFLEASAVGVISPDRLLGGGGTRTRWLRSRIPATSTLFERSSARFVPKESSHSRRAISKE